MSDTKTCSKCGEIKAITEFYTTHNKYWCKLCVNSYNREHYTKNADKIKAQHLDYYSDKREYINTRQQTYYANHTEEVKAREARYKIEHADKVKAKVPIIKESIYFLLLLMRGTNHRRKILRNPPRTLGCLNVAYEGTTNCPRNVSFAIP